MNEQTKSDRSPLAASTGPDGGSVTPVELGAILLSLLWIAVVAGFFMLAPSGEGSDPLRFVLTLMAIFLPVAMIWVGASAMRSSRIMREESARLQAAIDALRKSYIEDRQRGSGTLDQSIERRLTEIAQAAVKSEPAVATFATARTQQRRTVPPARISERPPAEEQPSLAFGGTAEDPGPDLPRGDLIRALNFPDNERDEAGFAALRAALKDRNARQLIRSSQDVLTLLSQDGIYMDDLHPDLARPEVWRRFANGERGRAIAALGGVRDRSSLALTAGRMREDTIFRDAAHHFLRKFDQALVTFEKEASDEEVVALSDTRTSRAFMLLGRVAGTFD
ncbi:hypothetical protein [Pelagovum pacificum]|uniref:Uncharacterized protein n=1 Tax=Pelagovum pacificum TaxID=2588711 RepID=A0A5C5GA16_9RHOB|nr:hypothetical protein [Pelagovum pacificum]QQA42544.1 hypothetical protein I8N54_17425 [Pelagovum pacificum]TNY31628.1 hypothetical protein FHY64_16620 [Pelagovum pacificum]